MCVRLGGTRGRQGFVSKGGREARLPEDEVWRRGKDWLRQEDNVISE